MKRTLYTGLAIMALGCTTTPKESTKPFFYEGSPMGAPMAFRTITEGEHIETDEHNIWKRNMVYEEEHFVMCTNTHYIIQEKQEGPEIRFAFTNDYLCDGTLDFTNEIITTNPDLASIRFGRDASSTQALQKLLEATK